MGNRLLAYGGARALFNLLYDEIVLRLYHVKGPDQDEKKCAYWNLWALVRVDPNSPIPIRISEM